ncbi:MAG: AAA family ATPase [Lachnospiraceae bacterium]|nr:AAA family ATPase [Lachnospiraceae bacterium]MCM1240464.1 AAA family ATPase [Lachnospiraceae bacterium]
MKTVAIINMKGGCGKTTTAVNMAHILGRHYGKRVLLVDNDKQGNASKAYAVHSYGLPSVADILTGGTDILEVIRKTDFDFIDVIPANMHLLTANLEIIMDQEIEQQTILRDQFERVDPMYDYCIIDCPPDINISVINALVAADEVIIPVKIDGYSLDGMEELEKQIENVKELNPKIKFRGCLVTMFYRTLWKDENGEYQQGVNEQGKEWLKMQKYPVFHTHIRRTPKKVDENTFMDIPLIEYSPRCGASKDYRQFVEEYLGTGALLM